MVPCLVPLTSEYSLELQIGLNSDAKLGEEAGLALGRTIGAGEAPGELPGDADETRGHATSLFDLAYARTYAFQSLSIKAECASIYVLVNGISESRW